MLSLEEIESGLLVTHKNTGLRYSVVDLDEGEVLLSPEQTGLQDLSVPMNLFRGEFVSTDRFRGSYRGRSRGRGRKRGAAALSQQQTYAGGARVAHQRGEAGLGIGARVELARGAQLIFQREESIAVDAIITAGGLGWGAVGEEIVDAEESQAVWPPVVEPAEYVVGVGRSSARSKTRAPWLTRGRLLAAPPSRAHWSWQASISSIRATISLELETDRPRAWARATSASSWCKKGQMAS